MQPKLEDLVEFDTARSDTRTLGIEYRMLRDELSKTRARVLTLSMRATSALEKFKAAMKPLSVEERTRVCEELGIVVDRD